MMDSIQKEGLNILYLVLGAIFGLFLTLRWEYYKKVKKLSNYKKMYSEFEGIYLSYNKYNNKIFRCFEITRKDNIFIILNGISVLGYNDYDAEITMDENIYSHGRGYYRHKKNEAGFIYFGFLEIQLTDNEILVHETIYNKDGDQNSDAYRWVRQDYSQKNELIEKYRSIQQKNKK